MSDLESLVTVDIPKDRDKLLNNSLNLNQIATKSEEAFKQAHTKDQELAVVEQTRSCVTHALASVAQQINNMTCDLHTLIETELHSMNVLQYEVNQLDMKGMAFNRKRDLRRLSQFIAPKFRKGEVRKSRKCRRPHHSQDKYISTEIDYSSLDKIGHGMVLSTQTEVEPSSPKPMLTINKDLLIRSNKKRSVIAPKWNFTPPIIESQCNASEYTFKFPKTPNASDTCSVGAGERIYSDVAVEYTSSEVRSQHMSIDSFDADGPTYEYIHDSSMRKYTSPIGLHIPDVDDISSGSSESFYVETFVENVFEEQPYVVTRSVTPKLGAIDECIIYEEPASCLTREEELVLEELEHSTDLVDIATPLPSDIVGPSPRPPPPPPPTLPSFQPRPKSTSNQKTLDISDATTSLTNLASEIEEVKLRPVKISHVDTSLSKLNIAQSNPVVTLRRTSSRPNSGLYSDSNYSEFTKVSALAANLNLQYDVRSSPVKDNTVLLDTSPHAVSKSSARPPSRVVVDASCNQLSQKRLPPPVKPKKPQRPHSAALQIKRTEMPSKINTKTPQVNTKPTTHTGHPPPTKPKPRPKTMLH